MIESLEKMLAAGQDSAALRFGLGNAYLARDPTNAVVHLRRAVELDPAYSAAWKLLGSALAAAGDPDAASAAFTQGITIAESRGDIQAAKEMRVFLNRLRKRASP